MTQPRREILVVEDNPITRKMVRVLLETDGFTVLEAGDGDTALGLLEEARPALVIQDLVLPDMNGDDLARRIRSLEWARAVPIVLVTGLASRATPGAAGFEPFSTVLIKPVESAKLLDVVHALLASGGNASTTPRPKRLLVVDDDATNRKLAQVNLHLAGYEVTVVTGGDEALVAARRERPDAILADVLMPGMDGFQLCLSIRADPQLANVPCVLVSAAFGDEADRALAADVGASELVTRTPTYDEAERAIRRALASDVAPRPVEGLVLERAYVAALQRQMHRQVLATQKITERAAIQAAALSLIGGVSEALARPHEIISVLGDVLVHCLDAVGLSAGVLYLRGTDGALRMHTASGVSELARAEAALMFGHPDLLRPRGGGGPRALSMSGGAGERDFLARLGSTSALVVPFLLMGQHFGSLLLASNEHNLSDAAWTSFGSVLAAQFGQIIALGQTTTALAESEELIRRAADASPNGMIIANGAGRIVMANRQAAQIFGYGEEELLRRNVDDLLPRQLRGIHREERRAFAAHPDARRMGAGRELFALHASGREIPVEIGLAPVERGNEAFVIASVIDISERREAERALTAAGARLQALMDNANDGVTILTPEMVVLDLNPRMAQMLGLPKEQAIGQHVDAFRAPQGDDAPSFRDAPAGFTASVPGVALQRPDGSTVTVDFSVSVVDVGGERLVISIGRDVTEQRSLEEQLREAQKLEAVGRLAAGVAHDFNNVLTVILTETQLLRGTHPTEDALAAALQEIELAAQRAAGLTRQLLTFSRKDMVQPEVLDPREVLEGLNKMLRRVIGEDVALTIRHGGVGAVRMDRGHLEQVIVNLVVNARDAMPEGGELHVEVSDMELGPEYVESHPGTRAGRYAVIAVSDTGHGMSREIQSRLFEPFFTTKPAGKGTGLGLATSHGIVKQGGGHFGVYSEVGVGTTMKVYLPVGDAEARRQATEETSTQDETGTIGATLLVVEDDEGVRRGAVRALERLGCAVLAASNADVALRLIEAEGQRPDLIFTDVVMPGMTGPELVARVRATIPDVKVLFTTGYTSDMAFRHELLDHREHMLPKPYTLTDLGRKVRSVLRA